ncbi:sodium channel protein Nach-like [Anticarsia gemmatalis]|uniref:sodium channel protein Nach-like n=1 Tax=Anticarsia gemmatalis TaxID=129554 RepID=UPI003F75D842
MPAGLPVRQIFWLVTIVACCVCSARVLAGALSLYTSEAVSYSVETDYLEFDTPFPSITICEKFDEKRLNKYLLEKNYTSAMSQFAKDVSFWNAKFCRSCLACKMGHSCVADFEDLVNGIRRKCTELLTRCSWGGHSFPCCERFRPMLTEYGTCFVFNSRLTDNETIYTVNRKVGLPSLKFEAIAEVSIRIQSSDDILSVASENVLYRFCGDLPLITDFELVLSAEQTVSALSVQRLAPSNRDCLFKDERPAFAELWPFTQYSYSTCLLYCRAIVQAEVCNCTHHFLPNLNLGIDKYNCPMSCDEMMYKVVYVTCPRHHGKVGEGGTHSHGSVGVVRLAQLPSLRIRRHAIRELLGLVVDIGGVIGVFFGASLLSFIEIFYLLFIRKYR